MAERWWTPEMVEAVATELMRDYASEYDASHLTWRDFEDPARAALSAIAPHVARHDQQVAAQALRDAADTVAKVTSMCGAYEPPDSPNRAAYEHLTTIGGPHYPDVGWSYCDGCAAAASADGEVQRTVALLRRFAEAAEAGELT